MALLESQLKWDPNQLLRGRQDQLKAELDRLRTEMQNRLKEMVAPAHMADLPRQVLSEFSGLKVVSVEKPVGAHKLVLKGGFCPCREIRGSGPGRRIFPARSGTCV